MTIYVDAPLKEKQKNQLKEITGTKNDFHFKDEIESDKDRLALLQQAEIVFGNPKPDWMKQAVNAKWIQLYSAGFEYYQGIHLPGACDQYAGLLFTAMCRNHHCRHYGALPWHGQFRCTEI